MDKIDPKAVLRDNAGARVSRRCRATGTTVTLYDGEAADLDVSAGRWSTTCEQHGEVIAHERYGVALSHLSHPDEWCESCMRPECDSALEGA